MPAFSLGERRVEFASDQWWMAHNATVVGGARIGHQANLWFNVVVRSDNEIIDIGERVNVQDGSVLHADPGFPLILEKEVCVGHMAMLHGCRIGTNSLIGMGSKILNGAVIGKNSIVGAGALIPERKTFPEGVLILGAPGKVVRAVTPDEIEWIRGIADGYVKRAERFRREMKLQVE
jgi:carbonic anhydrase/acetyltransferase-like protein (isoleucine patch superfamily)